MFSGDRISTWVGAPPHHWKQGEVAQVKQIHRCYRNAYKNCEEEVAVEQKKDDFALDFGDSLQIKARSAKEDSGKNKEEGSDDESVGGGKDEEDFLPKDSPLCSKKGDKKAPANPTFKDHEAFVNSCSFDFWRSNFENQSSDKLLSETAQVIVSSICNAQSKKELRVKKGKVPLRKKREQITPLALVLHEMKLWAMNVLRTANVFEADTYKEIKSRIKYLEGLKEKEVWGGTAHMLASGMDAIAHDKLLRLFLSSIEMLGRAHDYALRGYSQRSSREKLEKLQNNLKEVVFNEMRLISNLLVYDGKLSDPKTSRLEPAILLNSIENQGFVNYRNLANVLLYRLFKNALVKASFTGEYDKDLVKKEIDELASWSEKNFFCKKNDDGSIKFLTDSETRIIPLVYTPTAKILKDVMKKFDPKAKFPLAAKEHLKIMRKAYEGEEHAKIVMELVMTSLAAIQEVIPSIYAAYQLWVLAGDGGDFTVYDTLRDHVIMVMQNTIERVHNLETGGKQLLKEVGHLCKTKEEAMKRKALKTGKRTFKPAWVQNVKFINTELMSKQRKAYSKTKASLVELAKDAYDYDLTSTQIDEKVEKAKKVFNALVGGPPEQAKRMKGIDMTVPPPMPTKNMKAALSMEETEEVEESKHWIHESFDEEEPEIFGTNNNFEDSNDDARYNPFALAEEE